MNDALHTALKKLRLSGLTPSLDVRLQEATANRLSHAEFLELVLQDELTVRQDRLVDRQGHTLHSRGHCAADSAIKPIVVGTGQTNLPFLERPATSFGRYPVFN